MKYSISGYFVRHRKITPYTLFYVTALLGIPTDTCKIWNDRSRFQTILFVHIWSIAIGFLWLKYVVSKRSQFLVKSECRCQLWSLQVAFVSMLPPPPIVNWIQVNCDWSHLLKVRTTRSIAVDCKCLSVLYVNVNWVNVKRSVLKR